MKLPKGYQLPEGAVSRGVVIHSDAKIVGVNMAALGIQTEPTSQPERSGQTGKYGNHRVTIDGYRFDSKKEARRYIILRTLRDLGRITELEPHPLYRFIVNGVIIGRYRPDFRYRLDGRTVVEDVKTEATKHTAYRLRKRLMLAVFGIDVMEV